MSTYIWSHMVESLSEHRLTKTVSTDRLTYYVMRRPDCGHYRVDLIFAAHRIWLSGDIALGANQHGVTSTLGYGESWFRGRLSETYLCEKFLPHVWQWEAAEEQIRDWIENPDSYETSPADIPRLKELLEPSFGVYGDPQAHEVYEHLLDIDQRYIDDSIPGNDYPRGDAGWLCAIQQRFAALVEELA